MVYYMRMHSAIFGVVWVVLSAAVAHAQPVCLEQRIQAANPGFFMSFGSDVAIWEDTALGPYLITPQLAREAIGERPELYQPKKDGMPR